MNLQEFKNKALKLKDKAKDLSFKAIDYSKDKISSYTPLITTKEELSAIISSSKSTNYKNPTS
jgi:hypothetical protein